MRFLLLLLAVAAPALAQITNGRPFRIQFDYPLLNFDSNITFRAYQSTSLALEVKSWDVTESGWTPSTNGDVITFTSADAHPFWLPVSFLCISASNEWGEVFSNARLVAPPQQGSGTRLLRD